MTVEKIKAALAALDPANNNHWTQEGAPKLEAVRLLAGDFALSREQVTNADPHFTRKSAADDLAAAAKALEETTPPAAPPAAEAPPVAAAPAPAADLAVQVDQDLVTPEMRQNMREAALDGDMRLPALDFPDMTLAEKQEVLAQFQRAKSQLEKEIDLLIKEIDKDIDAAQVESTTPNQTAISEYLSSQKQIGQARGERYKQLKGVNLRDLLPKPAPVDAAFVRRTARGTQRPTR